MVGGVLITTTLSLDVTNTNLFTVGLGSRSKVPARRRVDRGLSCTNVPARRDVNGRVRLTKVPARRDVNGNFAIVKVPARRWGVMLSPGRPW